MLDILIRAASFLAIIALGYVLRRKQFFREEDFGILSKIVLKITLPAAIVSSFADKKIDVSMLLICLFGIVGSLIYMGIMMVLYRRDSAEKKAFAVLNCAGYNIGNFTLPFVQSFLGPVGVITTSLFDTGNSIICLGGAYSIASAVKGEAKGFPLRRVATSLLKSIPFDCFVIMTVLCLLGIPLPAAVSSFAQVVGNANAFLAMLMLGVGFKLSGDRSQTGVMLRILSVRYGVAVLLALAFYFLLPLDLEVRKTLALVAFAPIASAAPPFTEELKGDVGLSSALNSVSILCSMVCMVTVLLIL